MKLLVLLCSLAFSLCVKAQEVNITVSAQQKTINVILEDDANAEKALTINSSNVIAKDLFIICNKSWQNDPEPDFSRRFMIYDDKDAGLLTIADSKQGKYTIGLKEILENCKKGNTYGLYTIAIPKDPAQAAVVKVKRILVCKIEVQ